MLILIVIFTLVVIIGGTLNRITLYSIRKNTWRAKDMATIMQRTLNDNNYVVRLKLQNHLAYNLYGDFLPANGMTFEQSLEYIHPDDRHFYSEFIIRLVKGAESSECIFRWDSSLDKHEEQWHYIHDVGIVEYDYDDKKTPINFYCILDDQTDQILTEKEERELTDRYRKLFEQSIVGQAFYDKDGHLLTANQKLREILKFKTDDDAFYHSYTLFELPTFQNVMQKNLSDDLYFCTKTSIFERNVNCYTEIRIHPIYNETHELEFFTLYIRDISQERELYLQDKENEVSLQHSSQAIEQYETELKYLMENVDMHFFRTSFEKRQVTFYREMSVIEKQMGFDELISLFIDDPFAEGLRHPYEFFNEPKSTLTHMRPFFHNSNDLEWNFIDSIPYYDKNGKQTGTYGVVRNVTDLMNKQKLLKEETERANQSGIRKSTFLASMSHEIRTPLNAIVGFSDVLATMSTPEEREGIIQVISNNCELLQRLVNDILALSSLESGDIIVKPTKTDFAKCFNSVATSLAQRIKNPQIEFKVESPYPTYITCIDGGRTQQIITNFVTNAIKYTHQGHIKIGYEQQMRQDKEGIYIYCEDTGAGIPKEHQGKVFDRFVKLNDFIQGTGLGLSICKAIADNSGGEIGVTSEGKGYGSTFWVWIPCKQEKTA